VAARLKNRYADLRIDGSGIVSLRADPGGGGAYRGLGIRAIRPIGACDSSTTVVRTGGNAVQIRDVCCCIRYETLYGSDTEIYPGVPIYAWPDFAWRVGEGERLGQTFRAHAPFQRVGVYTLAAGAPGDAQYRVTLRRQGPSGDVLATRVFTGREAFDYPTMWSFLDSEGWPSGTYYLEISEARGDIRWWASLDDVYPGGCAYCGGAPVADRDLIFLYGCAEELRFTASWEVELDGTALVLRLHPDAPLPPDGARMAGLEVTAAWQRAGYDTSDRAHTPFDRFTTDKTQYVPIEQFKRLPMAWPAYQSPRARPAFEGVQWLYARGRFGCDVKFSDFSAIASWPLLEDEMQMRFVGDTLRIEFAASDSETPPGFPHFFSSAAELDRVHNAFFHERSFGLSDGHASGEWLKFIGPQSCWVGPPRCDNYGRSLLDQRLDADGYVWAMRYDGGYPHGLRYGKGPRARRHYGTNPAYITGAFRHYCWTRDAALLSSLLPSLRRAMDFMLDSQDMTWRDDLVVIIEPHHDGTTHGMASTAYDCLPFGYKCALTNAEAYEAMHAMAELERAAGNSEQAECLHQLRGRLRRSYNRHFWDEAAGRYIGCIDAHGAGHDFGFVNVNLTAIAVGLADADQVRRIYAWLEDEPTATGQADAYVFRVAPRTNTKAIQDWWYLGGNAEWPGDIPYGLAFQNGGAFMFLSADDLIGRSRYFGPDNAMARYRAILERYAMPDRLCGGNPLYLGEIDGYQVATSVVFPEAGLVPNAFLHVFLGVDAGIDGLHIRPALPSDLSYAGVRGLFFAGASLEIRIERSGPHAYVVTVACLSDPLERTLIANGRPLRAGTPGHAVELQAGSELVLTRAE
jgi:hypothetical protein